MTVAQPTASREISPRESVKETIESILVAFILAFIFRAFVTEAFVIPTGSMAPTLYGAHGTIVCADCGTEFAYGLRDLSDTRDTPRVTSSSPAVCPNCNHVNSNLKINDYRQNPETGDRILVFKWPYDIGGKLFAPARWDVVVFKDPADGKTNFIKRLVGMPDEVLTIIDGDVYTVPTAELSEEGLAEFQSLRHEKYLRRIGARTSAPSGGRRGGVSARRIQVRANMLPTPRPSVREELDQKLRIARKTPSAQEALWFLVYNHDYLPQALDDNQPRWSAALAEDSGWDTSGRRLHFRDRGVKGDYIELAGKDIIAACRYNVFGRQAPAVTDLRARFVLTPIGGAEEGMLRIRLEKRQRVFWATIEMNGAVTITESPGEPAASVSPMLAARLEAFVPGRSVEVSFENVDYRLSLRVRGEEVLATDSDQASAAYYGPDVAHLRSTHRSPPRGVPPRIYGAGGSFDVTHLVVERDVHYFHDPTVQRSDKDWIRSSGWGSADSPIMLRAGEYFMLGDNTAASKDSRLWDTWGAHLKDRGEAFQLGTVPADQLIGKAFFVYWPSPNRIDWLDWLPVIHGGIVPDVGRMRWIR